MPKLSGFSLNRDDDIEDEVIKGSSSGENGQFEEKVHVALVQLLRKSTIRLPTSRQYANTNTVVIISGEVFSPMRKLVMAFFDV